MNEYDLQVAKALEMARAKAGLSQEKLAKRLGISKPTVASRERGTSPVTLADSINWCVACSIPARRCMDACIYPGLLDYLQEDISTEEKRQILHAAVDEMSNYEVDGWLYLYYGDHGSDPMGVLTEVLANLHTTLANRVAVCSTIGTNYVLDRANNRDPDPNGTQPHMPIMYQARDCGQEAALQGVDAYSVKNMEDTRDAKK